MTEHNTPNKTNKWILVSAGLIGGVLGLVSFFASQKSINAETFSRLIPYAIMLGVLGLLLFRYFRMDASSEYKPKLKLILIILPILIVLRILADIYSHYYD